MVEIVDGTCTSRYGIIGVTGAVLVLALVAPPPVVVPVVEAELSERVRQAVLAFQN